MLRCSAVYLAGTYGATGGARAFALPLPYCYASPVRIPGSSKSPHQEAPMRQITKTVTLPIDAKPFTFRLRKMDALHRCTVEKRGVNERPLSGNG